MPTREGKVITISVTKEPDSGKNFGAFHRRMLWVYEVKILKLKTVGDKVVVHGRHLPTFKLVY